LDFEGGRTPRTARTRRDFAVALSHQRYLMPDLTDGQPAVTPFDGRTLYQQATDRFRKSFGADVSLLRLINEFTPELKQMGQNVSAERTWLLRSPFMRIPRNDPSYRHLGTLTDAELIHGYSVEINMAGIKTREAWGTFSTSGYLTPYQDAVAVTQAYPWPLPGSKSNVSAEEATATRSRAEAVFRTQPETIKALLSLIGDFKPVLEKLSQDVPAMEARLTSLSASPFPDVPKDHWAYQAVETVRQAGIIVGYPAKETPAR
jgi:hypothetical protein